MRNATQLFFRRTLQSLCLVAATFVLSSLGFGQCPTPSALSSAATCGQGATLSASGSTGLYRWYSQPSGGSVLGTGATYTTPAMYAQATYYVEAVNSYNNPNCVRFVGDLGRLFGDYPTQVISETHLVTPIEHEQRPRR